MRSIGRVVGPVTRVSIVEDEAVLRGMLEETLSAQEGVRVIHSVPGVQEARLVITPGSSDVAVLDVNLPDGNGVALGLQLQRADPALAIMLLSSEDVMGLFASVQDQAAKPWSYLSKRSSFARDVLVRAVVATAQGQVVLDPYLVQRSTPRADSAVAELTPAQFQVLRLVAEGLSNAAAAARIGIAERSVESHLKSIYQRLGIDGSEQNRRVAAVLTFLEQTGRTWRT
jgi:DNA-binding NarL/FixJ family response regulator